MSDEIEIEEHDVLDNPIIKRIFPDLSVIKKELNEYYDEASTALPQSNIEEGNKETAVSESEVQFHTYVSNSHEIITTTPSVGSKTETEPESTKSHLHPNIILFGSKPNTKGHRNFIDVTQKEPRLILENINCWLNKSKRFCKKCFILFSKPHLLNRHNYNIHTKSNDAMGNDSLIGRNIAGKLYKCNICERCMSSSSNLARHFKNVHGDVYESFKTVQPRNKRSNESSKIEKTACPSCFHCQKLFQSQSSLIEHLYNVLKPGNISDYDISTSPTSPKQITKEDKIKEPLIQNECTNKLNESNLNNQSEMETNGKIAELDLSSVEGLPLCDRDVEMLECTSNDHSFQKRNTDDSITQKAKTQEPSKQITSKKTVVNHTKSPKRNKKNCNKIIPQKMEKAMKPIHLEKRPTQSMFYKCFICSKFSMSFKIHARHIMNDHKIKKVCKIKKEAFDTQCKFCFSKLNFISSYNMHLYKYHRNIYKSVNHPQEQLNDDDDVYENSENSGKTIEYALKSIIFKCMECDLFFLSSNAAVNHSKHIRHKNTQVCEVCRRVLEKKDMALHKNQHSLSESLTVYPVNESTLRRILYKCSNCTVHYSEENFLLHHIKCDSETPDSLYCMACDILINRGDLELHGLTHSEKKIETADFVIIESDMIDNRFITNDETEFTLKEIEKNNRKTGSVPSLVMHFCHTCKCFVNLMSFKSNVHLEGKCGHMIKTVCKECGLLLTAKTHATHKQYHKDHKICLFDYQFYDLKTERRICPPVPDYPKCNMCGVHFLRNSAITEHLCQDQDYKVCTICSIKLTEHAYKLHMGFHNYSLQNVKTELGETAIVSNKVSNKLNDEVNLSGIDASHLRDLMIFYTCKGCHLTVNTYDKVVQHCQDHYDSNDVKLNMQKCKQCNYVFQINDYENHNMLHLNGKYNKNSIEEIDFDPIYFRFDNVFWAKHIFAYVSDDKTERILNASIYRYECRLQMEEVQPGSLGLVLFKCDKCQLIIEPHSLYTHAEKSRSKSCVKLKTTLQCDFCSLCFDTKSHRSKHEAEHESLDVELKSYKIVLFNKLAHDRFNNILYDASNRYILYQCRNCERVVDKFHRDTHMCDENNLKLCCTCGLLLHRQDFDSHFIRHEELDTFKTENIFVVMFGKLCYLSKKRRRSTFRGTIYDYTIYKCTKCDLCLSKKSCKPAHVCVFDNSKCKCPKCGLYFSETEMIRHSKLHESNVGFDDLTTNIISFEMQSTNLDAEEEVVDNSNILKPILEANETNGVSFESATRNPEKNETIFKCDCGLHFLEQVNAQKHANKCSPKMKISRQRCIKCDLLFTPGELFNHLLKHHCDKKLQFIFDIVNVTKKKT